MDMKEEMMSDAVDDVMDDEMDEEEEGDKILKEVLDEIGVGLSQEVRRSLDFSMRFVIDPFSSQLKDAPTGIASANTPLNSSRQAVALGAHDGPSLPPPPSGPAGSGGGGGGGGGVTDDDLEARLANLRK